MHNQELQRAITLTELAPRPYFSIIKVHHIDINVSVKFEKFPSLPIQDIEENPKCHGQMDIWMERQTDGRT